MKFDLIVTIEIRKDQSNPDATEREERGRTILTGGRILVVDEAEVIVL
jgi:hypothetical protein